jgi:hypothetical protein
MHCTRSVSFAFLAMRMQRIGGIRCMHCTRSVTFWLLDTPAQRIRAGFMVCIAPGVLIWRLWRCACNESVRFLVCIARGASLSRLPSPHCRRPVPFQQNNFRATLQRWLAQTIELQGLYRQTSNPRHAHVTAAARPGAAGAWGEKKVTCAGARRSQPLVIGRRRGGLSAPWHHEGWRFFGRRRWKSRWRLALVLLVYVSSPAGSGNAPRCATWV